MVVRASILAACFYLLIAMTANAAPDSMIVEGDLRITGNAGSSSIVFPDNTVQYSATVQGPQGPAGPQGPIGLTGPAGPTGPVGLTGATGPQGPQGTEGIQGEIGPIGLTGATGATGPQGPQGLKGDTGATGATGPQGPANTLSIGTVVTGTSGSSAAATITGTSPSQVLNLAIPQGPIGPSGTNLPIIHGCANTTSKLSGNGFTVSNTLNSFRYIKITFDQPFTNALYTLTATTDVKTGYGYIYFSIGEKTDSYFTLVLSESFMDAFESFCFMAIP